ncbi:MAG: hypothetical protein MMC23_000978 [Stictis urceolatum]|nr:hypothetical protein [Stictis urceolata]
MSSFGIKSAFGLVAALAAPALAQQGPYFVLGGGGMPLVIERLDPAISPGQIPSNHVHSVVGGNGWSATMDFAQTQKADCSTVSPKADKSNYWMPNLYFQDPKNGSFIRVPEQPYHKIYYKFGKYDNTRDEEIEEFPKEFRMIAGDMLARSEDTEKMGTPGTQLQWMCHGDNYQNEAATGFPTGFASCSNGFAASLRLPSCWNGLDFDPKNPDAHMAYPTNQPGRAGCPDGFQKARFPEIFVEYWFDVSTFDGAYTATDSPWVLSMGDPTGFGFHIDFINGWEEGVLNSVMPTCNPGNTGSPDLSEDVCFGQHGGTYTDDEMNSCHVKPSTDEDVGWTYGERDNMPGGAKTLGGVLDKLPGCNPIQEGPTRAEVKSCGDDTASPPASSAPASTASSVSTAPAASTASPTSATPSAFSGTSSTSEPTTAVTTPAAADSTVKPSSTVTPDLGGQFHAASTFSTITSPTAVFSAPPTPSGSSESNEGVDGGDETCD